MAIAAREAGRLISRICGLPQLGRPRIGHVSRRDVMDKLERYFENNPEALAGRHHWGAGVEALRYAFVLVVDL